MPGFLSFQSPGWFRKTSIAMSRFPFGVGMGLKLGDDVKRCPDLVELFDLYRKGELGLPAT